MSGGSAADLFALLSELDGLGGRGDTASGEADDWIDPVRDGQLSLDRLGEEMRRAAIEPAGEVGD